MCSSLKNLFSVPYNQQHKVFALYRFLYWKVIRAFRLRDVKFKLWNDRVIYLNHDSFQSMWIMYNYLVDWEEFNLIKDAVHPGDVVFDVGANMGFYTIWMSKFAGAKHIHSFEPDGRNFDRLTENALINNLTKSINLNKVAAGNCNGEARFTKGLDGENHIAIKAELEFVTIPVVKLDSYASEKDIDHIRYCKIDVEGFEYSVLEGASELLTSKRIDILQLEINNTVGNAGTSIEDLLKILSEVEYELCSYDVTTSVLKPVLYSKERENYFATHDVDKINDEIRTFRVKS